MSSSLPGSSVHGFSRQEYWDGLPCLPPGDFPHPGIKPKFPVSPAMAGGFFTIEPPGKPYVTEKKKKKPTKRTRLCFKRTKGCPFPTWAETEAELSEGGVGGGATLPLSNPTKEGDWPLTWSSVGHPDQSNANQRLVKRYPIRMFRAQHGKVNTPLSGENSSLEAQGIFLRNLPFGYTGMQSSESMPNTL